MAFGKNAVIKGVWVEGTPLEFSQLLQLGQARDPPAKGKQGIGKVPCAKCGRQFDPRGLLKLERSCGGPAAGGNGQAPPGYSWA